jgi:hypothetical protein
METLVSKNIFINSIHKARSPLTTNDLQPTNQPNYEPIGSDYPVCTDTPQDFLAGLASCHVPDVQ